MTVAVPTYGPRGAEIATHLQNIKTSHENPVRARETISPLAVIGAPSHH